MAGLEWSSRNYVKYSLRGCGSLDKKSDWESSCFGFGNTKSPKDSWVSYSTPEKIPKISFCWESFKIPNPDSMLFSN